MTAALASNQRAEQLESLRRKMAHLSGKPSGRATGGDARSDDLLSEPEAGLAVPRGLPRCCRPPCPGGRWRCCRGHGRCCWEWWPR